MLTQTEADLLIGMAKRFETPTTISLPPGADLTYDLVGVRDREQFLLDLSRGGIRLSKLKYQTRARNVIVLVRLDIEGAPHTNPDGTQLPGTHIHLYKEGFEDKWAYTLEPRDFRDPSNLRQALEDFFLFCNIEDTLRFQETML